MGQDYRYPNKLWFQTLFLDEMSVWLSLGSIKMWTEYGEKTASNYLLPEFMSELIQFNSIQFIASNKRRVNKNGIGMIKLKHIS